MLKKSYSSKKLLEEIDSFIDSYKKINPNEKIPDISIYGIDYENLKEYLIKKYPLDYSFKKDGFRYKNAFIKKMQLCDNFCMQRLHDD